jgi:hypothetical protein
MNQFYNCPFQWKLVYIDKIPLVDIQNEKAKVGTCTHEIIANYYRHIPPQPTADDIEKTAIMMFNHFFDPKLESYRKAVRTMIETFVKYEKSRLNNYIKPILIEATLEDEEFKGIIDYFDGYEIIDWKTGAINQLGFNEQRQGKIYEHLITKWAQKQPKHVQERISKTGFKVFFFTLKNGRKLQMPSITEKWLMEQKEEKERIIKSGLFPKQYSGLCAWCPVQLACEFESITLWTGLPLFGE